MNLNSIAADRPSNPQAAPAPNAGGASFQAAYAKVFDGRTAPDAAADRPLPERQNPARTEKTAHTVHAGDTLSAIVRARLAAMGAAANAGEVRQGVAQLAAANNIRNPDRIYAGQKLDLASLDTARGQPTVATRAPVQWEQEEMIPADGWKVIAGTPAQLPATTLAFTLGEAVTEGDRTAIAPMAARQVALYEQNAAGAAEKPAEPAQPLPDILYKGVVGKALDAMPLEPSTRAGLQRASTIVGNTFAARSLGALAGIGGPLGAVAGLIWGIFSSRQIDAAPAGDAKPVANVNPGVDTKQTAQTRVAEVIN